MQKARAEWQRLRPHRLAGAKASHTEEPASRPRRHGEPGRDQSSKMTGGHDQLAAASQGELGSGRTEVRLSGHGEVSPKEKHV